MPIFTQERTQTIPDVLKAIVNRAKELHLDTSAWSLAELHLDEVDFTWLSEWAKNLESTSARQWLCPQLSNDATAASKQLQYRGAIGTVFLLFAAEYARRCLPRYSDWLVPVEYVYRSEIAALLFSHKQPSLLYQSALRLAIKRLGLRTMPDWDSPPERQEQSIELFRAEQFNRTLALQYGFTLAAIDCGLTQWVMEKEPSPEIRLLLDEQKGSKSFRKAWTALRAYNKSQVEGESLREILSTNPWILPSWMEHIQIADQIQLEKYVPISAPSTEKNGMQAPGSNSEPHVLLPQNATPVALPSSAQSRRPLAIERTSTQDIFAHCTPFGGLKTIVKAVRAIFSQANAQGIESRQWSLAELRATDYDYIWLRTWVKRLEPMTVAYCKEAGKSFGLGLGDGMRPPALTLKAGIGLLLLLWMTETARRHATEGELWPVIHAGSFQPMTAEMLITRSMPTAFFRQALQAGAREARLRHSFDEANAQYYLNTVYLQFGFTYRGIQNRLTEWLAGQSTTLAIRSLLDPEKGSKSFQKLWESLRDFRHENITEARLRHCLQESPWVIPEWIEEIIEQALAKIDYGAASADVVGGKEEEPKFLTMPVLRWNASVEPYFLCHFLPDLSAFHLQQDAYELQIAGKTIGQLLRQANGQYLPTFGLGIRIPVQSARVRACLMSRENGGAAASQEIELWPDDDDISIFKLSSGQRLSDAYTEAINPQTEYALLLASDLTIDPRPAEWFNCPQVKLVRLQKGWPANTRVLLEGEALWEPLLVDNAPKPLPTWASGVYPFDLKNTVRLGETIHLKITHPADVHLSYVRCDGRAIEFSGNGTPLQAGPIMIGPAHTAASLKLQIGARKGATRQRVRHSVDLEVIGAAQLTKQGWRVLTRDRVLTMEEAANDLFKILPPKTWENKTTTSTDWVLMEGDVPLRSLWQGQKAIGRGHGLGAPLTLRYGSYNSDADALWIARSMIDEGILQEAVCEGIPSGGAMLLRLRLRHSIEPGPDHAVIWWDTKGEVVRLTPDYYGEVDGDMWWMCELPEHSEEFFAVALAWKGLRLGAQWIEETRWPAFLPQLAEINPTQAAVLLRWFRLPVLSRTVLPLVRSLGEQYATEFIPAWIKEGTLPDWLQEEPIAERWKNAFRKIFQKWQPKAEEAESLLMKLSGAPNGTILVSELPNLARILSQVDPLLLGKLFKAWKTLHPKISFNETRLQLSGCSVWAEYSPYKIKLLETIHSATGLAEAFIEKGILARAVQILQGAKLSHIDQHNIAVALQLNAVRSLMSLNLLEKV